MTTIQAEPETRDDQRVVIMGVTWDEYETYLSLLEDHPSVRLYYLDGNLEIMATSPKHERTKSMIRRVIEYHAFVRDIDIRAYGHTTFKEKALEKGAEPDECYVLGAELDKVPDFLIEVVVTHGGLDKLAIYGGLGVPEVWFWIDGSISIHRLGPMGYERVERSAYLPDLDPAIVAKYASRTDQHAALKEFAAEIGSGR